MPTATATPATELDSSIKALQADVADRHETCEQVLRQYIEANPEATINELWRGIPPAILNTVVETHAPLATGVHIGIAVRAELSRVLLVIENQAKAGTDRAYKAARTKWEKAAEAEAAEGFEINRQIDELHAKMDALKEKTADALQAVETMDNARNALQSDKLLPEPVRAQIAYEGKLRSGSPPAQRALDLEGEIATIKSALPLTESDPSVIHYLTQKCPEAILKRTGPVTSHSVDSLAFQAHKDELRERLPAAEKELEEARAEVAAMYPPRRDHYVKNLG